MKNETTINFIQGKNNNLLRFCICSIFIIGIIAHGYVFFQDSFSHDSLNALYAGTVEHKHMISLGRFLVPLYRSIIRGGITVPWLIGILTFIWMTLLLYVIVRIFKLNSKALILATAGIICTNITIIAWCATYIMSVDIVVFGIFLAAISVYLWNETTYGWIKGIPLIAASMAIYQSNVSVVITMIMFVSILALLGNGNIKDILKKGFCGIGMIILGAICYVSVNKLVSVFTCIPMANTYNSLSRMFDTHISLFSRISKTYQGVLNSILIPVSFWKTSFMRIIIILLSLLLIYIIAKVIKTNHVSALSVALCGILLFLLPFGMNVATFFMGDGHDLMHFSVWFIYLFALICIQKFLLDTDLFVEGGKTKKISYVMMGLIICVIWNNIVVSNTVYMKKDLEQENTFSLMTRVVDKMEAIEGYIPGKTPVAFIGALDYDIMPGFEKYTSITGMNYSSPITGINEATSFDSYKAYFNYVLNLDINMCSEVERNMLYQNLVVQNMPVFPDETCMQFVEDILVVKLGKQ